MAEAAEKSILALSGAVSGRKAAEEEIEELKGRFTGLGSERQKVSVTRSVGATSEIGQVFPFEVRTVDTQPTSGTPSIIEACRRELERLHEKIAEFIDAIETSQKALSLAATQLKKAEPSLPQVRPLLPGLELQMWGDKAAETRCFAEQVSDHRVKLLLLEIAEIQEQFAGKNPSS